LRENPSTIAAAKAKIMALIMRAKRPKVRKVMGKAKKAKIGRTKAFNKPKTKAEIRAVCGLLISTPVGNLEITKS